MPVRPDHTAPLTVACLCAGWCVACQGYVAPFAQVASTYPDAHFVWIDIEEHSDALGDAALDIENFPTVMVLQGRQALFLGTVLPHPATLARLVQAAQDGSLADTGVNSAMAGPVADLAATLQGVATAP
jgi:thiol-disulfide isomerase/thioredoxin